MRNFKKVIGMVLIFSMILVTNGVYAKASGINESLIKFYYDEVAATADTPEAGEAVILDIISYDELKVNEVSSKVEYEADPYEPNDSASEAYAYSRATTLSGNKFIEGYKNSNIHVAGDEDWFFIYLTAGVTYDVILKNIYDMDRNIYIYQQTSSGMIQYGNPRPVDAGQPEHYLFTPKTSGKYYIQIEGGDPYLFYYFFAVEKQGTLNTALWPSQVK